MSYREIEDPLFFKRIHAANSMQTFPDWRARMQWFGDDVGARVNLPHWAQLGHYLRLIATAPVPVGTKARCYGFMFVWVAQFRRWRSLGKDLVIAASQVAGRCGRRIRRLFT